MHRDDRPPLVQFDARDFADLRAGDRDRLTLARRDRLGGYEFALQREVFVAEHRKPCGQRKALVVEDVAGAAGGDHDDRHDREERAAIAADLVAHAQPALVAEVRSAPAVLRAVPRRGRRSPALAQQIGNARLAVWPRRTRQLALALGACAAGHLALLLGSLGRGHPALPSAGPWDSGPLRLGSACV